MEDKCNVQICALARVTGADKVKFRFIKKRQNEAQSLRKVSRKVLMKALKQMLRSGVTASIFTYGFQKTDDNW